MPFCRTCGSSVEGQFCPKCGAPIAAAAPGAGAPPPPPPPQPTYQQPQSYQQPNYQAQQPGYQAAAPQPAPAAAGGMADNVASLLCYLLGILGGILFLVLEPYNRNRTIRFHAFQSLFFAIAMIPVVICLMIVSMILAYIPVVGAIVALLMWPIFMLGCLVLWIMLMVKAYQGQKWVLPVIGPLAEKQA